jgi:hypothetical protein
MTDAIAMAGMRDDPIHYVLEAFVVGLALLSEATERPDQERALITPEERRQFIAQVSRQTARIIANRAAPVKWPVWAMIVILILGIAAGTATGHFAWPADVGSTGLLPLAQQLNCETMRSRHVARLISQRSWS